MKRAILWTCAIVVALVAPIAAHPNPDPTDLELDGVPGIAAVPENPSPAIPSVLVGTGTLLIDRSHGNGFNVSGFTNYLASQGWMVLELNTGPVTEATLEGVDVFMVPVRAAGLGPIFPFSDAEATAVQSFLSRGEGLWVLHDNENPSGVNTLSAAFGVIFQYDSVRDPSNNEGEIFWPTIHLLTEHSVTEGVASYGYYSGDCLAVDSPASIIARADDDAYSFFCPAGSYPPVMAFWEDVGRAFFAGDITTLHPSYYPSQLRAEEQLLLQNIANWLLGDAPTPTSSSSWGIIKARFAEDIE